MIVRDNQLIAEGWNMVTLAQRSDRACRNRRHPPRLSQTRQLHAARLRALQRLNPARCAWQRPAGARVDRIYFGGTRVDAANAGFDDEWLYCEINRPQTEKRPRPSVAAARGASGIPGLAQQDRPHSPMGSADLFGERDEVQGARRTESETYREDRRAFEHRATQQFPQ